ncbi:MAG TPA: cobyrinic acid a,c-diamide synthase, partial [Symbiobacteriaceae bacterium]|nr:cobyrinic acid a,c-diamide synthase [Symbiobacteriaceae bacterium]
TRAITDSAGRRYPMVGRLPTEALMAGQGLKLGYVEATALCDHLLAAAGETVRGHEFHCSQLTEPPVTPAWSCQSRFGAPRIEGFAEAGILASYIHQHFAASPTAARRFTDKAILCSDG